MKTVRIVSDGTVEGTRVFDLDGKQIEGISRVEFVVDANDKGYATAKLFIDVVAVEVIADSETVERKIPPLPPRPPQPNPGKMLC